ncbi:MAG: MotA/TolQ/ExbB proton channel family protein [Planctomycetes bacterium]|nr:MotA/TolQ/ExbB proton channel family protein [Planctomycetota bacterium]
MNPRSVFRSFLVALPCLWALAALPAQQGDAAPAPAKQEPPSFEQAAADVQRRLAQSLDELAKVRERIAAEKVPMDKRLREAEAELQRLRGDYQELARQLDTQTLDLGNLRNDSERRRGQTTYLSGLLGDYLRGFESRLHIAELQRYGARIEQARLAMQNQDLPEADLFLSELAVVDASIDRVDDVIGGARFDGKALDQNGLQEIGTFVQVGPAVLFRAADGKDIGLVDQVLGSLEPNVMPLADPDDRAAAAQLVFGTGGAFPLDPTLGNAHKIAAIEETWLAHVQKGGPVMVPIFVLAGLALLVVLGKWLAMAFLRQPSRRQLDELLDYVRAGDRGAAVQQAGTLRGPVGRMLRAGAEHLDEPRELVEEVMFEQALSARLKLNSWLPFVAICATSAPLLGLLGTVTGIMGTFELMTVYGTGDPKTLSSGISEALITTEYGLIVAIPSLLLHAFLSRRARGIQDGMEKAAVAMLNELGKSQAARGAAPVAAVAG